MRFFGGIISYLFLSMCIAHPICLCVAMIGYLIIRKQMMLQVSQEMLRGRVQGLLGSL